MTEKIRLETETPEGASTVEWVEIPDFCPLPEVVTLGERTFIRSESDLAAGPATYRSVFAFAIPVQRIAREPLPTPLDGPAIPPPPPLTPKDPDTWPPAHGRGALPSKPLERPSDERLAKRLWGDE